MTVGIGSWEECQWTCLRIDQCDFFAYDKVKLICSLQKGQIRRRRNEDFVSGLAHCL